MADMARQQPGCVAASAMLSTARFMNKCRNLIGIPNAPCSTSAFLEEVSGLDLTALSYGAALSWAFFLPQTLDPDRLKRSFMKMLQLHPSAAGRLQRVAPQEMRRDPHRRSHRIDHCNAGVEFTEAFANVRQSYLSFPFVAGAATGERSELFEEVVDQKVRSGQEALMKVKYTFCADGGSILGVSASTVLADAPALLAFVQRWAAEYRGDAAFPTPRPFQNRQVVSPASVRASFLALEREAAMADASNPFLAAEPVDPPTVAGRVSDASRLDVDAAVRGMAAEDYATMPCCVIDSVPTGSLFAATRSFCVLLQSLYKETGISAETRIAVLHFGKELTDKLVSMVHGFCDSTESVSTRDAVFGLLWTTLCEIRRRSLPGQRRSEQYCSLSIDLRKRLRIPETFFGNASYFAKISGERTSRRIETNPFLAMLHQEKADMFTEAFVSATRRIAKSHRMIATENGLLHAALQVVWSQAAAPWTSKIQMAAEQAVNCDCYLLDWRLPIWDVDFGGGSSLAFHFSSSVAWPYTCTLTTDKADGLVVAVSLPNSKSEALRESAVLKYLAPTVDFSD